MGTRIVDLEYSEEPKYILSKFKVSGYIFATYHIQRQQADILKNHGVSEHKTY